MKKFLKCEVDGECYNRSLEDGHAVNPEQVIELAKVEDYPYDDTSVLAYPAEDVDVQLIGRYNDTHVEHLFAGHGFVVSKKFIQNIP